VFVGAGLFVVFFAVVWIVATIAMGAPFFFPLFGVGFVVFAVVILRHGSRAHDRARALRAEHEQRRADLVARLAQRGSGDVPGAL
jgi:membrane protein implicated in regulation of membrane protease activity